MPDVSQTEVGRRLYHVHREKRVENAIRKLREHCGSQWKSLTEQEVHELEYVLSAAWNAIDQKTWESIPFASMSREEIGRLLAIGRQLDPEKGIDPTVLEEIRKILLQAG